MQVAYCAVGVYGCEGEVACRFAEEGEVSLGGFAVVLRLGGAPTLAVVSVRLLRVVDLPDEGLPTRAMRGSRGMVGDVRVRMSREGGCMRREGADPPTSALGHAHDDLCEAERKCADADASNTEDCGPFNNRLLLYMGMYVDVFSGCSCGGRARVPMRDSRVGRRSAAVRVRG